jgi:hypothetical protein
MSDDRDLLRPNRMVAGRYPAVPTTVSMGVAVTGPDGRGTGATVSAPANSRAGTILLVGTVATFAAILIWG